MLFFIEIKLSGGREGRREGERYLVEVDSEAGHAISNAFVEVEVVLRKYPPTAKRGRRPKPTREARLVPLIPSS